MPKFGLEVAIARMIDDIIPDDVVRQERAVKGVVADDATVLTDALAPSLPWQRADVHIPGPAVAASSVARVAFPQGALIRHISIFAGTAPSGTYNATAVSVYGSESFSLQAGSQAGMERLKLRVPADDWVTINVTSAGGAADVTLVLHYSSVGYSAGSSSGGAGGGGTAVGVVSVNGKSGTVVLNADDIDDSVTTHKFMSAADATKLTNLSGVNTGDQDLSGYVLASSLHLVATSGDYDDLDNKPTLGTAAAANTGDFATAIQGGKADTAVQPGDLGDVATSNDYDDLDNKPTIPAQFNPIAGANVILSGTYPNVTISATGGGGGGGGDMFAAVYDPTSVAGDAFDMDNMVEGSANKILTTSERSDIASAVQPGDLASVATSGAYADLTGKPTIPDELADLDTTVTGAQLDAIKSKVDGIQSGAEVNVQSDWSAASGDAHILNKPSIYTQAQVDALIAAVKPKQLGTYGSSSLGTINSAGLYTDANNVLSFTNLDDERIYSVDVTVEVTSTETGPGRSRIFPLITGYTTYEPATARFADFTSSSRVTATFRYVMNARPASNGSMSIAVAMRWMTGTVTISAASIAASLT